MNRLVKSRTAPVHCRVRAKNKLGLALLFIILAAFCYSFMSVFVKLSSGKIAINVLIFFRYGICLLCILPFGFIKPSRFKTEHFRLHLIRGLFGLLSIGTFFYSVKYMPLAGATLLSNTTPIFIPIILWLFWGKKIIGKFYIGILIGIIGVFFILDPGKIGFQFVGLIALVSAIFRSISLTAIRSLTKGDSPITVMFYYFFIGTVVTGISLFFNWNPSSDWPWLNIFFIGIFGAIFQLLLVLACKNAPTRIVIPFMYLTVVFSAFADWIIWGNVLTFFMVIGILLIFLSAVLTIFFGKELLQK